ncbi:MAG: hypothetical protein OEM51_01740 [Gammaproteobacteria bacterium]|nr:hypothetical protein [Gammaproteobacteria bacterium]
MRMSKARLERVQRVRKEMSDLAFELLGLSNDAADPERQAALYNVSVHAAHAALDLSDIVKRDAALVQKESK